MTAIDKSNLYLSTLQKTFGLTPEKAFHTLTQRKFDTSRDDVDGFASDLVHLVSTAFQQKRQLGVETLLGGPSSHSKYEAAACAFQA